MNYRKITKPAAAMTLSLVMAAGSMTPAMAASNTKNKEENIYVNLDDSGSVDGVYVVNTYDLKKDQKITDYGNYSSLTNLSSDSKLNDDNGKITVNGKKGKFYYQGNLDSAKIPWDVDILYELDGEAIDAKDLAGKSGKLKITIKITQNKSADKEFFEDYLLQVSLALNTKQCKDIKAKGATTANSGDNKQLMYNIMASQEKEITITTNVEDFEMDPISFSGVPMSFDINTDQMDTSKLTDKTKDLTDGVKSLNDGAKQLKSGSSSLQSGISAYGKGVDALYKGADSLFAGVNKLNPGIKAYTTGVDQSASGAKQLQKQTKNLPNLMTQMTSAITQLNSGSSQLADKDAWNQIESGFTQIEAGLKQMKAGLKQMDQQGLTPMIASLEDGGSLKEGVDSLEKGITAANAYNDKLKSVASTYDEQVDTLGNVIKEQKEASKTTKQGAVKTDKDTKTEEGTYKEDHTETSKETSTDEDGNTVITVTNNIYMTKTDTVTNTVTNTQNTETSSNTDLDTLESLYKSMSQNSAMFHAILNGNGSSENPGLSTVLSQLSSGTTQLKSGLYSSDQSMKAYLTQLQTQISGENGLTSGIDTMILGVSNLKQSICGTQAKSIKSGTKSLNQGITTLKTSTNTLPGQMTQLTTAIKQLSQGTGKLSSQSNTLIKGSNQLQSGAKALANGGKTLSSNTSTLTNGAQSLTDGVNKLADGTQTFYDKTGNIDDQILDGIDEAIDEFSGKDYKVKSFVSSKNKNVKSVQFVMKTEGITKQEKEVKKTTEKKTSVINKIKNLFK